MSRRTMVLFSLLLLSAVLHAASAVPPDVTWLAVYDAASGKTPDASEWISGYRASRVKVADGALQLDNSGLGADAYQHYQLKEDQRFLTDPDGDPVIVARVACMETPRPSDAKEFPGFFQLGFFGTLGEGNFGVSTMWSQDQVLLNFSDRIALPCRLEIGVFHEIVIRLHRAKGAAEMWLDGESLGVRPATMSLKKASSWGDGSGGVCGRLAVESIRYGLADVSDEKVYLPGFAPYVPPAQVSGIIQNEDCTQFYYTFHYPATKQGLEDYLTECYLPEHTQITEFFLNPQSQRASYDSKVLPPAWRDMTRGEDGRLCFRGKPLAEATSNAISRMKELSDNGVDAYAVWIELLRRRGISPWISLRMNDVHDASNRESHMHNDLWREHPEFRIAPYRRNEEWFAQQLDYAQPEVREQMLRLVDEVLERYDCDGLELHWMRFCRVFRYGHEMENRHILTDFVRTVREKCDCAAERLGHPVKVAVRVQMDPVDALNNGFDVQAWCSQGLVDMVIPAPFFDNNWERCPLELWRALTGPGVLLAPCLDTSYKPQRMEDRPFSGEFDNALATYYLAHGADRIYLFNHFGNKRLSMRTLGSLEKASSAGRRHVTLYKDDTASGCGRVYELPRTLPCNGEWVAIRLSLGRRPEPGRRAWIYICSRGTLPDGKMLDLRLNGDAIEPCRQPPSHAAFPDFLKGVYVWDVPEGALFDDGNVIECSNRTGSDCSIDWVEIYIEPLK